MAKITVQADGTLNVPNNPTIPFIDTVRFMQPFWAVRLIGGTLMFGGILLFFWNIVATFTGRNDRPVEVA